MRLKIDNELDNKKIDDTENKKNIIEYEVYDKIKKITDDIHKETVNERRKKYKEFLEEKKHNN